MRNNIFVKISVETASEEMAEIEVDTDQEAEEKRYMK